MSEEKYIGYFKYTGKSVEDGILDARKSAEALIGFDELLRFFVIQENPEFRNIDFEIPVRIKKGSIEFNIPDAVNALMTLKGVSGAILLTYGTATAAEAAKNGLLDTGLAKDMRKVFRGGLRSVQWTIKIATHLGSLAKKKYDQAKIRQDGSKVSIEIPNEKGEILTIPKKYFDQFNSCPEKIFSKNAHLVDLERTLEIGIFENGQEEKISITTREKSIFYLPDETDILFPELVHGQPVALEGEITRGNEKTNTIGFEYNGHVLTCLPDNGHIATFKNKIISQLENQFFPPVRIIGYVDRMDKDSMYIEKRPRIIFQDIVPLEEKVASRTLFE